eukprot:TRINITY_DN2417_c0_g2_i2.p1 TRINITY_DN2417_c0_g2~~TRINITY_DN2417_c0_g2_i2.p1  ORF type:complete len:1291 (+),score=343.10 TRINITY_DN2417_c0_g2_i2:118-3990(+)
MKDMVYTNIGQIVVALNPWNFKIPWYMPANMPNYLAEGEVIKENVPHSWAQAHNTYFDMRRDAQNQTILISGESGAGKTEAAKIVMNYLGSVSCLRGEESKKEAARKVAFNINQASPILEGFGNAKTVRNPNSSRFGKFMKIQFDEDGFLVGAFTIKYLLEKSRIVTANKQERVYHSFYLLLKGKDASKYQLSSPDQYHVNAGGCIDIVGKTGALEVDDGEDYSLCYEAMTDCGFTDDQKSGVWKTIGGILHFLQVKFTAIDQDSCSIDPSSLPTVDTATSIWGVDAEGIKKELVTTTQETRGEVVVKKLNAAKSADARDAVVKGVYDGLFQWQVDAINQITDSGTGCNFIGVLDIFGFEDFEYNSFEQLCINLANETLQNHYNDFIFTKDMEQCKAEGVDVTDVKPPDNGPCLELLRGKSGIISLLDDECSMGTGSDDGLLEKVLQTHSSHNSFAQKKLSRNSFIIHHYAASVNYTVENWLDKNKDTLRPDMKHIMRASTDPLIARLIPEPDESAKKLTIGGFFKQQLMDLMDLINSTSPHWIRCVKPHPDKQPLLVHGIQTMTQLESSGVLGTVKIRKAGFPVRPTYDKFIARFKCILGGAPPPDSPINVLQEYCKKVIEKAQIDPKKGQIGKVSRVFLKYDSNQHLEALREKALMIHVLRLQMSSRSKISEFIRREKLRIWGVQTIQTEVREWLQRSEAERAAREAERKELLEKLKSVLEPFNAEEGAAYDDIIREEEEEFTEIQKQFAAGLSEMMSEIMAVVTNAEATERELHLQNEEEEWQQLFAVLKEQKSELKLTELIAEEERLRNAIEIEWFGGSDALTPTDSWNVTTDVTPQALNFSLTEKSGISGLMLEYFNSEMVILSSPTGEWSEPFNRNIIKKEELKNRKTFNRLFVIDWTEARLSEEEFYEYIFREDIKDSEETEYRILLLASLEVRLKHIESPKSTKGMDNEPGCRRLIQKERRDFVRRQYRFWKLLKLQSEEEFLRDSIFERNLFCCSEFAKRDQIAMDELDMRSECQLVLDLYEEEIAEKARKREKRQKRREKKIRALHTLWSDEVYRMEQKPYELGEEDKHLIELLDQYRDATTDGCWDTPDGREPIASLIAKKREIEEYEVYMNRIEAGEDPPIPNISTDNSSLWQHLRREQLRHSPSPMRDSNNLPEDENEEVDDDAAEEEFIRNLIAEEERLAIRRPPQLPPPPPPVSSDIAFVDQIKQHVTNINNTVSDAALFREAMNHSNQRIGNPFPDLAGIPRGNTQHLARYYDPIQAQYQPSPPHSNNLPSAWR